MAEPFLAEIRPWACTFAPRGWATCDGQLMLIGQNSALFSLIGTIYGGDGKSTFALPNLQGRVPVGAGAGPGLTPRQLGEAGGSEKVLLTSAELPEHAHGLQASSGRGTATVPNDASVMTTALGGNIYSDAAPDATMAPEAITAVTGGGAPHNNVMPYQVVNFCIALQGLFPQRP
ncbi:MAG TPA: tail fiber protein [Longimicrobiales bacterium]